MHPPVESLNVAIAAALVLYEASRQRCAIGPEPSCRSLTIEPSTEPAMSAPAPLAERMRPRTLDEFVGQER